MARVGPPHDVTDAGLVEPFVPIVPQENLKLWEELPGFHWHYPVRKLKPGATSLLAHPRAKMGDQPMPVLATHQFGRGQVVFVASDETWRWRYNAQDKYFGRFWGQVIYQMGLPHVIGLPKRVQLALERPEVVTGLQFHVYARVFDAEFRPFIAEKVNGRLERMDAKEDTQLMSGDTVDVRLSTEPTPGAVPER